MDSHEELLAALGREEEQDKRIKGYQRQIGWQQRRIRELDQQIEVLVDALKAIQSLAQNPNHRTMRTQLQMCSFFDDIVLPITDTALVEGGE